MDSVLERLIEAVTESDNLESLVRPLLSIMQSMTGLESVYLTTIDWSLQQQRVLFARNQHKELVPEGLTVDWEDALCRRAIADDISYTRDIAARWPDAHLAIDLGIKTYFGVPIQSGRDHIRGTLCAIDHQPSSISAEHQRIINLFATLIAHEWERELLLDHLRQENSEFSRHALSDPLTEIANRRGMLAELSRLLANARRQGVAVHLAFIDLDGFKGINDRFGHEAGDRFLQGIAQRLKEGIRQGDFVARYGGDEFVAFGLSSDQEPSAERAAWQERLQQQTMGHYDLGVTSLEYSGASVGVVTSTDQDTESSLLQRADTEMYRIKQGRKHPHQSTQH